MTHQGGDQEDKGFEKNESVTQAEAQVSNLGESRTGGMTSCAWLESLGLSEPVRVFCVPTMMLPLQLWRKTRQKKRN